VLLSTYNGAPFLPAQLDSLRAQEGVVVDLQVRDDGSSDETLAVLARYADTWPALAKVASGPNLGPAMSFLELLSTAPAADFYAFCDQDDVWLPHKLSRAVQMLAADKGPALYCSNVTLVADDLTVLGVPPGKGEASLRHLLFENIAYGCTTVINAAARTLVLGRPPQRGVIMHDWWIALAMATLGVIRYDPEPSILYRQHGRNAAGATAGFIDGSLKTLQDVAAKRGRFQPLHGQAEEFLRLYGDDLKPADRLYVERFVASKRSLLSRLAYAATGPVTNRRLANRVLFRGLIAAGWY
jgi:glycosyltransferase involved in cell wall biosynthesis